MANDGIMSRRSLLRKSAMGAAVVAAAGMGGRITAAQSGRLRLGGPVFEKVQGPDGWVTALRQLGYSAAYCPVGADAGDDTVRAY